MVSFLQLPTMTVRCIALYGVQSTAPGAASKNQTLWYFVLGLLQTSDIPTIVGGDFNVRPQTMEAWGSIASLGFHEAFDDHFRLWGEQLPPTCNEATRHDTLVYSSHFARAFRYARVYQEKWFPAHDPLVASFDIATYSFVHRALPMPEPLHDSILQSDIFQTVQKAQTHLAKSEVERILRSDNTSDKDPFTQCLNTFGKCFEASYCKAVDLHNQLVPQDSAVPLPRKQRGDRLHSRKPMILQPKQAPRKARNGDYEPVGEVYKIKTLQWVKQLRRIKALYTRMIKHNSLSQSPCDIQNQKEWFAICHASGFRPSFRVWCFENQVVLLWPLELPSDGWLVDLHDRFKHHVDRLVDLEIKTRKNQFRHQIDLDLLHFGGTISHAIIKPPKPEMPSFFELSSNYSASLSLHQDKSKPHIIIDDGDRITPGLPLQLQGEDVHIQEVLQNNTFVLDRLPSHTPCKFVLSQSTFTSDPELVAKAFFEFWAPFWLRDQDAELQSIDAWADFQNIIRDVHPFLLPDLDAKHTVSEWVAAIKTTKVASARGVCGFSQPEMLSLHHDMLELLIDILFAFRESGLPEWMMLVRTVLIPKKATSLTIKEMRPITIFSLIFRLWCKVSARRLLLQWSYRLPLNVVGSLPKRSCTQLTLGTALKVEESLVIGSDIGGFSLDISKCFNCFGRIPLAYAMKKFGFGENLCHFWLQSISKTHRTVGILNSFSKSEWASTGLAEGDPLSVCGMVIIGYLWHMLVFKANVETTVYADDWAWIGKTVQEHLDAMVITRRFLETLKLTSDPAKCWAWGSTKKARKWWVEISNRIVGSPGSFRVCLAERELGAYLHFSKTMHLGCQNERLENGVLRLKKLKTLPAKVERKALLIQTNVWPAALFGTDCLYLGQSHFNKLRSLAADALVVKTKATCPWVAMLVSSEHVMDPLQYTIYRALLTWRRMMVVDTSNIEWFLHVLTSVGPDPNRAYGPAVSLHSYLKHISWKIDSHGKFVDHLGVSFALQEVSAGFVASRLLGSWDVVVGKKVHQRHDFSNWPEPFGAATCRLKPPDHGRDSTIVSIHQTLGPVYGSQKAKWSCVDSHDQITCPLCEQNDDRVHFPVHCPGLDDLRESYARLLEQIKNQFPHMLFWPVMYKHPKHDLLQTIHAARLLPDPFDPSEFGINQGQCPRFYTDGSCRFPTLPSAQLSAFAIVYDNLQSDAERAQCAELVRGTGVMPSELIAVQVALTPGPQTINRAEFSAILQIIRSCTSAIIVTDSQWSISLFEQVSDNPNITDFVNHENFDLIVALIHLCEYRDLSQFQLKKVKSHLSDDDASDSLHLYDIIGNRFADSLANKGTEATRSPVHEVQCEVSEWYSHQQRLLKAYLGFLVLADIRRSDAKDKLQSKERHVSTLFVEDLLHWQTDNTYTMDIPQQVSDKFLGAFIPGASVLQCLLQWATMVKWPTGDSPGLGISVYELAVNFVGTTHCLIPRVVRRCKYPIYRDPLLYPDADLLPLAVWDVVRLVEHAVTFASKYIGIEIFPSDLKTRKVFLKTFGYTTLLQGYAARPLLPSSDTHYAVMTELVGTQSLGVPKPFAIEACCTRRVHELDYTSHEERLKNFRKLENEGSR